MDFYYAQMKLDEIFRRIFLRLDLKTLTTIGNLKMWVGDAFENVQDNMRDDIQLIQVLGLHEKLKKKKMKD